MDCKRIISAVSGILLSIYMTAAPDIRASHPRIMFNSETWPLIKARAESQLRPEMERIISKAQSFTDNPVAENTGPVTIKEGKNEDGTYISATGSGIKGIVAFGTEASICALAWRFTGNSYFLEKTKKMLKASLDGYIEATNNRRPVNWYSTDRINWFCAYDWIYESLTDKERAELIVPMTEHIDLVQPEAGLNIPRQPPGSKKTGFYGMASLLWYSGLAAYGDGFCDERAKRQLDKGYDLFMEVMDFRNETAGDDGGLVSTAINYSMGNYPFAHFNFMHSLASSTGISIAHKYPNMALFPYWVWWTWIKDSDNPKKIRIAGVADTYHDQNVMGTEFMYEHFTNYMHFFGRTAPDATDFTAALREYAPKKSFSDKFPVAQFLVDHYSRPDNDYVDKLENPRLKARHFESMGQILMRSGWTPDDTYCCFTAGAVVTQHKHYDENSFTIYKYDHLALDTGDRGKQNDLNLNYWYCQSVAHNLILIQKPNEALPPYWGPKTDDPDANYNYGGQINKISAKILAFSTDDDFTYVASDATESYGEKAKECVRQFIFLYPDYFIVYDRVESGLPEWEKSWLLHSKNEPSVKDNVTKVTSDGGRLFCQTFLPENARIELIGGQGKEFWIRDRNFEIAPRTVSLNEKKANKYGRGPYTGRWRVEIKPANATSTSTRFLNVITVGSNALGKQVSAKYVKDEKRDGVIISFKGKKCQIMFNRNGKAGGTINLGKQEMPLSDSVQGQEGILL